MMMGSNVFTIILMLLTGYSDHLHPAQHPLLSTTGMAFPLFLLANMAFLVFWLLFKWTKAWIPVVGFLLAYVPIRIYIPFHPSQTVPDQAIKLVSYNVCGYPQNNEGKQNGLEDIINYLSDSKADIICIQEDNDTWRKNIFDNYHKRGYIYNDTLVLSNSELSFNCLGIHTRYPIIRRERINYSTTVNNGSCAWWLKVGNDTVIVINNHFESCHLSEKDRAQYRQMIRGEMDRDSVRTESKLLMVKLAEANAKRSLQIDCVCEYVRQYIDHYPIIVCGDFNDNPLSYSHHAMSQLLTDCFGTTGKGIGLSYNQKAFSFRIDHIFCSTNIQPYNTQIDTKIDVSDHYPIACWLKIDRKPI